jgi:hypothetical protein
MGRPAKIKEPKLSKKEMYLGNPNLPSSEAKFEYTPEMVMEIEKCRDDMLYFAKNFFYIIDPDRGKVRIELYDFQERIINGLKSSRFNILLSPRQASKTTMMCVAALHEACFKDYRTTIIVANKESTAIEIFRRVRMAYEEMPTWLKPAVKEWGKTGCEFHNGSRITISTTTGSAIRGTALNLLILDELAFIDDHLVDEFWKSVYPTISRAKTSRIIIASTPNGKGNLFHKLYTEAEKGENGFNALRIEWDEIPGRDEEWKREQIRALGSIESFLQEFACVCKNTLVKINTIDEEITIEELYRLLE